MTTYKLPSRDLAASEAMSYVVVAPVRSTTTTVLVPKLVAR